MLCTFDLCSAYQSYQILSELVDLYDATNPDWAPSVEMGRIISQALRYDFAKQHRERKRLASDTEECRSDVNLMHVHCNCNLNGLFT